MSYTKHIPKQQNNFYTTLCIFVSVVYLNNTRTMFARCCVLTYIQTLCIKYRTYVGRTLWWNIWRKCCTMLVTFHRTIFSGRAHFRKTCVNSTNHSQTNENYRAKMPIKEYKISKSILQQSNKKKWAIKNEMKMTVALIINKKKLLQLLTDQIQSASPRNNKTIKALETKSKWSSSSKST